MNTFGKTTHAAVAVALLLGSGGCAALTPNTPVTAREQAAGVGALGGGVTGAIIGSMTGSALAGGLVGMPLGALAGYYYGDKVMPSSGNQMVKGDDDKKASVTFADVLFEFDSATMKKDAGPYIKPLVSYLNDSPNRKVWIEGHTDNVGTAAYNLELSTRRAEAVSEALVKAGINSQRIAAKGVGEAKPIATNDTAEGRTMNRRVEVDVF